MPISFESQVSVPSLVPSNPLSDRAESEAIAWALNFDPSLSMDTERLRNFESARFPRLASRSLPEAPLAELQLVCDWITWLFFYDDLLCDDLGTSCPDPIGRLRQAQARMMSILRGAATDDGDSPLVLMLADLRGRTAHMSSSNGMPKFMGRFLEEIERYFQSNVWEVRNLTTRTSPTLPVYLKMRPFTGAAAIVFALIELARGEPLESVRSHVLVQQLELLANNAICWTNDAGSFEKELRERNPHNLVLLLQAEQRLGLDEALSRAVAMRDAEEAAFSTLAKSLCEHELADNLAASAYVANLASFIRGNSAWMCETRRYGERLSMRASSAAA